MRADEIELSLADLRALTGWAASCAAAVLPVFERHLPADRRPRVAIDAATAFAAGAPRTQALRVAALDAYRAAREATDEAAGHAAHAASAAAGAAFLHPLAKPTQVKHILGAAARAALARGAEATRIEVPAPPAVVALLHRYPAPPEATTDLSESPTNCGPSGYASSTARAASPLLVGPSARSPRES